MKPITRDAFPALVALALLAATACGGPPVRSAVQEVRVSGHSLDGVELAVPEPGPDAEARCDDRVAALGGDLGGSLSLVWTLADTEVRRVTVRFDDTGAPLEDAAGARAAASVDLAEAVMSDKLGRPEETARKVWAMCSAAARGEA